MNERSNVHISQHPERAHSRRRRSATHPSSTWQQRRSTHQAHVMNDSKMTTFLMTMMGLWFTEPTYTRERRVVGCNLKLTPLPYSHHHHQHHPSKGVEEHQTSTEENAPETLKHWIAAVSSNGPWFSAISGVWGTIYARGSPIATGTK